MGSKQELIKTENGTALGMPVMIDGRRALLVKAGRHFDILTPEKAAALIAGVPEALSKLRQQGSHCGSFSSSGCLLPFSLDQHFHIGNIAINVASMNLSISFRKFYRFLELNVVFYIFSPSHYGEVKSKTDGSPVFQFHRFPTY